MEYLTGKKLWALGWILSVFAHISFMSYLFFYSNKTLSNEGSLSLQQLGDTPKYSAIFVHLPIGMHKEISSNQIQSTQKNPSKNKSTLAIKKGKKPSIPMHQKNEFLAKNLKEQPKEKTSKNSVNAQNSKQKNEMSSTPPPSKDSINQDISLNLSTQKNILNSWQGLVLGHLNNLKLYPQVALMKKEEGRAIVKVLINPLGEVISVVLLKSSQSKSLDNESLQLIKRASPLPKPPKSIIKNRDQLSFTLPIDFNIKLYFSQKNNRF